MKVAFLVQTHKSPAQVQRLVQTLLRLDPDCFIHISHDRTGPRLELGSHDRLFVACDEGGRGRFHNVARWLDAVRWLQANEPVDYVLNLTGQDYPVMTAERMHSALAESGDGLMEFFPVLSEESNWGVREGVSRYTFNWHQGAKISPVTKKRLRALHALNFAQPWARVNVAYDSIQVGLKRSRLPEGLELYGGSFFVNLSWACVEALLATLDDRRDIREWAASSLLIEEAFFQSLLLSFGDFSFVNSSARFYDFSGQGFGSPAVLGRAALPSALQSGSFFARKFDWEADPQLFDIVDEVILAGEPA